MDRRAPVLPLPGLIIPEDIDIGWRPLPFEEIRIRPWQSVQHQAPLFVDTAQSRNGAMTRYIPIQAVTHGLDEKIAVRFERRHGQGHRRRFQTVPPRNDSRAAIGDGQDDRRRILGIPIIRDPVVPLEHGSLDIISLDGHDLVFRQVTQQLACRHPFRLIPCGLQDPAVGLAPTGIIYNPAALDLTQGQEPKQAAEIPYQPAHFPHLRHLSSGTHSLSFLLIIT